jgi:hypothetical protein
MLQKNLGFGGVIPRNGPTATEIMAHCDNLLKAGVDSIVLLDAAPKLWEFRPFLEACQKDPYNARTFAANENYRGAVTFTAPVPIYRNGTKNGEYIPGGTNTVLVRGNKRYIKEIYTAFVFNKGTTEPVHMLANPKFAPLGGEGWKLQSAADFEANAHPVIQSTLAEATGVTVILEGAGDLCYSLCQQLQETPGVLFNRERTPLGNTRVLITSSTAEGAAGVSAIWEGHQAQGGGLFLNYMRDYYVANDEAVVEVRLFNREAPISDVYPILGKLQARWSVPYMKNGAFLACEPETLEKALADPHFKADLVRLRMGLRVDGILYTGHDRRGGKLSA